jgi:hypothetical protein
MDLKTVSSGMANDVPGSGRVVIIIVHQAINLPHLPHNLLNPMQIRLNDVVVNETPKFQCANPTNLSHTITVEGENMNDELIIPLDLRGVVSCFTTRKPTQEEFDTCDRYELTYESPVCDPSGSSYAEQEAAMGVYPLELLQRINTHCGTKYVLYIWLRLSVTQRLNCRLYP